MRQIGWGLAFLVMLGLAALAPTVQARTLTPPASVTTVADAVRSFGGRGATRAWAVSGAQLLLTDDGGASWRTATPPGLMLTGVVAVAFHDDNAGWVATLAPTAPGVVTLAATTDGGRAWQLQSHTLFAANDAAGHIDALTMHWLDRTTGWLVVRQATSRNFNQGSLFATRDGGASWQRRALPGGEAVYFVSATTGWSAGGPNGDRWWRTDDGGHTWAVVALPYTVTSGRGGRRHYPPVFTADGRHGVVVVTTLTAGAQRIHWYATHDGGARWALVAGFPVAATAAGALAELDAAAWLLTSTGQPLRQPAAAAPFFANPTLDAAALATVAVTHADAGWALDARGARLLHTQDGGQSWQVQLAAATPTTGSAIPRAHTVRAAGSIPTARTARLAGPGFDMCELAGAEDLQQWMTEGPYRAVNLYIGGDMRACDNVTLDAARLATLTTQGWSFIPTWVGPQAPCTDYHLRFDLDPATAYAQGRAEAEKALQVATRLQLANTEGAGTVIYYDLEAYDGQDTACVAASQAFVTGWTARLQASDSYAGLYALACNPAIGGYASLAPTLDAVWFAAWNRDQFDPAMTIMAGIPTWCLAPTVWSQQQRIRQYTGGHDETWGGVTLNIDSNVLDGIVADLRETPPPLTVVVATPEITPTFAAATACADGWHRFTNVYSATAYLAYGQPTGATIPPLNYGLWRPTLPITGTYRVEAFIPSHDAIAWPCRPATSLSPDTSQARYTVYHRDGATTTEQDQLPLNDAWLHLGSYPFAAGSDGFVYLDAAIADAPKNVSFSALRFVLEGSGELPARAYLPMVQR